MDTIQTIETRCSVRIRQDRLIARAALKEALQVATFAPSRKNTQTVGYPAEEPTCPTRKALGEKVNYV